MKLPTSQAGVVAALALPLLCGGRSFGQAASSPETIVDLNEGVREYLQGHFDPEPPAHYEAAIGHLTSVLETEPDNAPARLFRALSYGRIGLLERARIWDLKAVSLEFDEILETLAEPTRRQDVEQQRDALDEQLQGAELTPPQRLLHRVKRNALDSLLLRLDFYETQAPEELHKAQRQVDQEARETAQRERANYERMREDVEFLIRTLESPEAVLALLEVVALTKTARIDETTAYELKKGAAAAGLAGRSPEKLRAAAAANLERAAGLLREQLEASPTGPLAVRTRFFLGVIRFRQATPRRTEDEDQQRNRDYLRQAEALMTELASSDQADQRWRSYAELYLGLICTELGADEGDAENRQTTFAKARRHLDRAAELDTIVEEGAEPRSDSKIIPYIYWRQQELIDQYEESGVALRFRNDFQLSVHGGAHRDSNVLLLGERTDLPREIPKEQDFGFTLGATLDYTLDLGRFDRKLDRWTLGVQGRVGQLWHVEVDEFDEQNYGGSAAVQYELLPERGEFGPAHLRLQYDYDYTLLGRDAFVETQSISPNIRVFWLGRRTTTDVYFVYSIRDYREPLFDRRFDRDGEYYRLGWLQSFKTIDMTQVYTDLGIEPWGLDSDQALRQDFPEWPARHLQPYVGVRYAWDSTEGDEFDTKAYVLTCGAQVPLPYGLVLDAATDFEWQEYAHGSLIDFHRRPRRDLVQRYSVGLTRTFVLRGGELRNRYEPDIDRVLMTLRGHATWTLDDSNIVDRLGEAIFEYDRVVYGLSVAFTFN